MKLLWLTDIHLNFLNSVERHRFYQHLATHDFDKVVISGDIGEHMNYHDYLLEMDRVLKRKPIYYVHGNHDFWHSSFRNVQSLARLRTIDFKTNCYWLNAIRPLQLTPGVFLIGVDGFYDTRNGDYENAGLVMRDFYVIDELYKAYVGKRHSTSLQKAVQQFADKETRLLVSKLRSAKRSGATKIIAVTHVPPAAESCFYRGELTDEYHLPLYSNQKMFDALTSFAVTNPAIDITVLSGHTHGKGEYKFNDNLLFKVGSAEYDAPDVAEVIPV